MSGYVDIIKQLLSFGLSGLVLLMWYYSTSQIQTILKKYEQDMAEQRKMYENNVVLVQGYEKLATDLSQIIHLNTQMQTRLAERIENNLWCPVVREAGPKGQPK